MAVEFVLPTVGLHAKKAVTEGHQHLHKMHID